MKVKAVDLLHEAGKTYQPGEVFEIEDKRGKKLAEIGLVKILKTEKPKARQIDKAKKDRAIKTAKAAK